jgi:hypothetical protein
MKIFPHSLLLTVLSCALLNPTIARADDQIKPGEHGRSGESKTIFLSKPQAIQLDLSGTDGADGKSYGGGWLGNLIGNILGGAIERQNERDREQAYIRYPNASTTHPAPDTTFSETTFATSGPDGGNGGNGGNGGTLTVYYQNLNDLKNVQVIAKAGKAGRGGSGGSGTSGKSCTPSSEANKPPVCTETQGTSGSNGRAGKDGVLGLLRLVKRTVAIAGDSPIVQQNLQSLIQTPIALTKNRWDEKPGALGLLASGSVMDDRYQEYRDRIEKKVMVSWNAGETSSEYLSQPSRLALTDSGTLEFDFINPQLWTVIQQSEQPDKIQLAIRQIIREPEVTQLTSGITNQSGRSFSLNVIDTAAKSDVLNTQFSVRVRSVSNNGRSGFGSGATMVYEGAVPTNLVTRDYNRFILNLGGLPIDSEVFKVGADLEVEIVATRSLGSRSTQKKIDWSGTVY